MVDQLNIIRIYLISLFNDNNLKIFRNLLSSIDFFGLNSKTFVV